MYLQTLMVLHLTMAHPNLLCNFPQIVTSGALDSRISALAFEITEWRPIPLSCSCSHALRLLVLCTHKWSFDNPRKALLAFNSEIHIWKLAFQMHFILCLLNKDCNCILLLLCPHFCVLNYLQSMHPFNVNVSSRPVHPNVSTTLPWRMMVFNPGSILLVLPHLIGLKQLYFFSTSVVTGRVIVWSIEGVLPCILPVW